MQDVRLYGRVLCPPQVGTHGSTSLTAPSLSKGKGCPYAATGRKTAFTPPAGQPGMFRVRISDHKLEQVVSLKDFRLASGWTWVGQAPDDSPLLVRDAGTQDIYALDWEAP